jgi:poly-beta-1,6-N-acetyl-D-glucosamine synthase
MPENDCNYVIITPVRDEVDYIQQTIYSVSSQTWKPVEWIVVDDGSTDGTRELLEKVAVDHSWVHVIHNKNRGFRASGSGVMEAFYIGYAEIMVSNWDFLVKLDGDLKFGPWYFEKCIKRFLANPKLGIGGGTVCILDNGRQRIEHLGDPPFHVRGATKIYRHECWEMIKPLVKTPGWDTIDEVKANYFGWETQTFSDIELIQLKATGTADGRWKDFYKNGVSDYICGYHPAFMLAKCLKRMLDKPVMLNALGHFAGYVSAFVNRKHRDYEPEVVRYLQRQQIRKLMMQSSIYGR